MNTIKKIAASTMNFVENHKVGVTFLATAAVCLRLNKVALRDHDEFLREHGLYDTFYTLPDEEV